MLEQDRLNHRRKHSLEFKQAAVRLITEKGLTVAQAARDLGLNQNMLGRWKQELSSQERGATSSQALIRDPDFLRLQRENEILRQERDILKKAVGIFSRP